MKHPAQNGPAHSFDGFLPKPFAYSQYPAFLILSHPPVVTAQSNSTFQSDDFSNNLFTDLVPLLALFGEEVSKQFMSQAMGWLDDIIFAMCPLGIITAMVSAIRAGGTPSLKALIGRAREPVGAIEIELLSSTSSEVCELYGEQGIVRVPSSNAEIEQWIYEENDDELTLYDEIATEKCEQTKSRVAAYSEEKSVQEVEKSLKRSSLSPGQKRPPPSILLNYHSASGSRLELSVVAITGLVLQSVVLIFGALVTYRWEWTKAGAPVASYGYPMTAAGTLSLSLGLILCSRVVEASTNERVHPFPEEGALSRRIVWLQKAQTAADNVFRSAAIFGSEEQGKKGVRSIRTSSRNPNDPLIPVMVWAGVPLALIGYVAQLVGFRELHSSVALVQFAATVTMIILRAWVRRGLLQDPQKEFLDGIPDGREQDWLSTHIAKCFRWTIQAGFKPTSHRDGGQARINNGQRVLEVRRKMAEKTDWELPTDRWGDALAKAIQATMTVLTKDNRQILETSAISTESDGTEQFEFKLRVQSSNGSEPPSRVSLRVKRQRGGEWEFDKFTARALLSLWLYDFETKASRVPSDGNHNPMFMFGVGTGTSESYILCYKWICQVPSNWLVVSISTDDKVQQLSIPTDQLWFPMAESVDPTSLDLRYCVGRPESPLITLEDDSDRNTEARCIMYKYPNHEYPIAKIFTHHIFSLYMRAIGELVEDLGGITRIVEDTTKPNPIIENSILAEIASVFVKEGLGTQEEAYMCIIPRLAAEEHLPWRINASGARSDEPSVGAKELLTRNHNNDALRTRILEFARETGDKKLVQAILEADSPNNRQTALQLAASHSDEALIDLLLEARTESEVSSKEAPPSKDEDVALRTAAQNGNVEIVKKLLEKAKANLFSTDEHGSTALHLAAERGNLPVVTTLLDKIKAGLLPEECSSTTAGESRHLPEVTTLERKSASVALNRTNKTGDTPLSLAAWKGHPEIVDELLKSHADPDIADSGNVTPLNSAAWSGHYKVVELLLNAKANPTIADYAGQNPLSSAASGGHEDVVKLLLGEPRTLGVINHEDEDGETPLFSAANNGHTEIVKLLVQYDANVNVLTKSDDSALRVAARDGNDEMVQLLLEAKADPLVQTKDDGYTPLHSAARYGHDTVLTILLRNSKENIDTNDAYKNTALFLAADNGEEKCVEVLLKNGAKAGCQNNRKATALISAARYGYTKIVQMLLTPETTEYEGLSKLEIDEQDDSGFSALEWAVYKDHKDIVQMLLSCNADVSLGDTDGDTALHLAAMLGCEAVVKALLAKGANWRIKNNRDKTARDKAHDYGYENIVNIFDTYLAPKSADSNTYHKLESSSNKI